MLTVKRQSASESGLGMIEVLVSLLILSLGLLSMASLQVNSTKVTSHSARQTQALFMAEGLVERIRANPQSIGDYDGLKIGKEQSCEKSFSGSGTGVSHQKSVWKNDVVCLLGGVEGTVSTNSGSGEITVELSWEDRMETQADGDSKHTLSYKAAL